MKKEISPENPLPVNRLCSEIQLFDLCDLDNCGYKNARFCSNAELLARFEAIKEEDEQQAPVYEEDELEDDADFEHDEDEDYSDALDDEGYGEDE